MQKQKQSLKPLKPTLRGKKRYVLFKIFSEKNFDDRSVERAIFSVFLGLYGSTGVAKQSLRLMRYNNGSNLGILRCSLETIDQTKAGLLFLKTINGLQVTPKILSVSGSIKKLKSKR